MSLTIRELPYPLCNYAVFTCFLLITFSYKESFFNSFLETSTEKKRRHKCRHLQSLEPQGLQRIVDTVDGDTIYNIYK